MANENAAESPKHLTKEAVRYLALEGGGGKGATYLGAIKQLEKYDILPIQRKPFYFPGGFEYRGGSQQLLGLCGSSAGAITALMLALGLDSKGIESILVNNGKDFESFCDTPRPGVHRIYLNGKYQLTSGILSDAFQLRASQKLDEANSVSSTVLQNIVLTALPFLFTYYGLNLSQFPFSRIFSGYLTISRDFAVALLNDGGLFLGAFTARFFDNLIYRELAKFESKNTPTKRRRLISFKGFREITDVDLRITGTNLYSGKSHYFSATLTPDFPVAVAVSISMNLPLLFKPVIIDATLRNGSGKATDEYKGLWVDGGLLNNLPLHAFDDLSKGPAIIQDRSLKPLNEGIIALRLTDGRPGGPNIAGFNWTRWINLTGFLPQAGMVLKTIMAPAEEGQIRTPHERARTIDLFTYDLSTINFAPSPSETKTPIDMAEASVKEYFEGKASAPVAPGKAT